MEARALVALPDAAAVPTDPDQLEQVDEAASWVWIDVVVGDLDDQVVALGEALGFDSLAVRDVVEDIDFPKIDDFGDHLLVVLHGLGSRDDRVVTYELDCFVTGRMLVTLRTSESVALEWLWDAVQQSPQAGSGGADELLAKLADVLCRRFLGVIETLDSRTDELIEMALAAHPRLVADLTAVRSDVTVIRRAVHPQREILDQLRRSSSELIGHHAKRRFSDVFDVAERTLSSLEASRATLAETLDAYRGAEAREATEVTKVLTIYAAVMLPLSLIAGFWGMNFDNLPGIGRSWGWWAVFGFMLAVALVSLGMFVATGWIRPLSARRAGALVGRGLIEAAKTPIDVVGSVYEVTTLPLRHIPGLNRLGGLGNDSGAADDQPRS